MSLLGFLIITKVPYFALDWDAHGLDRQKINVDISLRWGDKVSSMHASYIILEVYTCRSS